LLDLAEAAQIYYSKYFTFKPLLKIIKLKHFNKREFGFTIFQKEEKTKRFIRNYSFEEPSNLKSFIIEKNAIGVYIGAIYDPPPSPKNPITKNKWQGRELIFDLDLTDYDDIRECGKGKDHYCPKCWPLITKAAKFIDESLKKDFGFEEIIWVYSGRRGLHAWVLDEEAFLLDEKNREAIAEYLTVTSEHEFFPPKYYERAIKIYANMDQTNLDLIKRKEFIKKIWKNIVKELPRIDKKVTMDIVRLLRVPGSIHDETGKIVTIIEEIEKFYPDEIPDVWEVIGEKRKITIHKE